MVKRHCVGVRLLKLEHKAIVFYLHIPICIIKCANNISQDASYSAGVSTDSWNDGAILL